MTNIGKHDALLIVDVQRDFLDGGALEVKGSIHIIPIINRYIEIFKKCGAKIIASRDWHPPNHMSFKPYGGPWPVHCVRNSKGAEFHPELKLPENVLIISKATEPDKEAYSAFQNTGLENILRGMNIKRIFVCGVATEYCVKSTALDAISHGFETVLLIDAIKGIDEKLSEKAIEEMKEKGIKTLNLNDFHCQERKEEPY